ncbi:MAG: hypothetical protein AAF629_04990, partial [Chloroflexota bacterium]
MLQTYNRPNQLNWLMPRSFDWVCSIIYGGMLVIYFTFSRYTECDCVYDGWWAGLLMIVFVGTLFGLDRWEAWRGENATLAIAVGFLISRLLITTAIAFIDDFKFSSFVFFLIPFTTFFSLGMVVSYLSALVIWLIHFICQTTRNLTWYQDEHVMIELIIVSAGLVFVVTIAHMVAKERFSRDKAETLLKELEITNQQLRDYATQVADLATTKERNRLARE